MNDLKRGVLTLLKSAVTGQAMDLPEGFSLQEALPVIKKHQLITLAYEGAVNCRVPQTSPEMRQLLQMYLKLLLRSERQMEAIQQLCQAFDDHGIDYMPVKGCNMKPRYPKPELRAMGDADILIRMEQYDRIVPIMEGLGFTEKLESDHELVWTSDSLYLELHKRLIPSYNRDYYAYFGDGWRLAKCHEGTRYAMTPEDEWIYLFTHFAKHYRDGGIGCRHVLDLYVFRQMFPELDTAYVERELTKLQLVDFYRNICRLLDVWFEDGEADNVTRFMTTFIFQSGSWGEAEAHILSAEVRKAASGESVKNARVKAVLGAIFPSAQTLQYAYPVLQKAPWLLPVIWVIRWFDVLLFRRDNIRKRQKSLEVVTDEKVEAYQQSLQLVGLDFNFGDE